MKRVYRRRGTPLSPQQMALGAMMPAKASEIQRNLKLEFDDVEDYGVYPRRLSPEKRLVVEVMACACRDFLGLAMISPDDRESARAWLFDGDVGEEPFTFETACGLLGIDPERGRDDIIAQMQQRRVG